MPRNNYDVAALAALDQGAEVDTRAARVSPASALAEHLLDAVLTRRHREALKSSAKVIIVETFDEDSVELILSHLRKLEDGPLAVAIVKPKSGTRNRPGGADELLALERGTSIAFVTSDAAASLASEAHAAADCHILVRRPTTGIVRKTIRSVTGSIARGLTDQDLARLTSCDIISAIRPGTTASQCVANLKKAAQYRRLPENAESGPRLEQLALTRAVRAWSDRALGKMRTVTEGTAPPESLRHVLLQGPPGTGKTTIAAALARSAGWQFRSDSVAGWFATSDGHLGGVVKAASLFFDELKSADGPIVGFLDELDGLPDRAALAARDTQWWTPVITHTLLQIDLVRQAGKPILLVGATNHADKLDGALIRSGRLEVHVPVLLPDFDERADLFEALLKGRIARADAEVLARLSPGATPAMIESQIDTARATARARGAQLKLADLVAAVAPPSDMSLDRQRAIALHEAGHAIVAFELGIEIEEISIISRGDVGGSVTTRPGEKLLTKYELAKHVTVALGGRAADILLGEGAHAGAVADLMSATKMLEDGISRYGLFGSLRWRRDGVERGDKIDTLIASELDARLEDAMTIIELRHEKVELLTRFLIAERVISGARVTALLAEKCEDDPNPVRMKPSYLTLVGGDDHDEL